MKNYTIFQAMDIETLDQTLPNQKLESSELKVLGQTEVDGMPFVLVQCDDSSVTPYWLIPTSQYCRQELLQQTGNCSPNALLTSMNMEHSTANGHLKQIGRQGLEMKNPIDGKPSKRGKQENYENAGVEQIKAIVDRFLVKIKATILKLKDKQDQYPNQGLKVICLYNAGEELEVVVEARGECRLVSYRNVTNYYPSQLRKFFEETMMSFNNNFCQTLFSKNYRYQAYFLGQIFDNGWSREPSGRMVRLEKQKITSGRICELGVEASAHLKWVELAVEGMMIDEAEEERRRDYRWGTA